METSGNEDSAVGAFSSVSTWSSTQSMFAWYAPHIVSHASQVNASKKLIHLPSCISKPSSSHAIETDGALEGARGVGNGEVEGAELGRLPFAVWQTHRFREEEVTALQKPEVFEGEENVRLSFKCVKVDRTQRA